MEGWPPPSAITTFADGDPDENPFVSGAPPAETIEIAAYSPEWPALFQASRELIALALAGIALNIEHVGLQCGWLSRCHVVDQNRLACLYLRAYVTSMGQISIRELQKISGEAIGALPGPTPVKSGNRTVGLLIPLKTANPDHLAAVLARAASLAKDRDPAVDEAVLADMGIDPTDWSVEAVQALRASHR
jgi:hypothetical protein